MLLCVFSLSACETNEQRQQKASQEKIKRNGSDDDLPTGQYFADDSQRKIIDSQRNRALNNVANQMGKNYRKIGNVKYDSHHGTITLNLKGSQMSSLVQYAQQHNSQALKFWKQLTTGLQKTSKNLSNQLRDNNLKFNVNDPNGKLIYSVQGGNVKNNGIK